jgi:hypothetical protein
MRNNQPILEYIILLVVIMVALAFFLQVKNQEINFCRAVFTHLVKGSAPAEKFIDWENFKAVGMDVGATYNGLPNEKEKSAYRQAFIKSFSVGFSRVKAELKSFTHWRLYAQQGAEVVVACDYSGYNKTLLFTVSKLGKKKLVSLQWKGAE